MEEIKETLETKDTQETQNVSELSNEEGAVMENHLEQEMKQMEEVRPGDIITGTVVQINSDEVLVDVGGKSEGIIPVNELSYRKVTDPNEFVNVGDQIKVLVLKVENSEGNMILSKRRADQEEALKTLEEAFKEGKVIEAEAIEVVKRWHIGRCRYAWFCACFFN